MEVFTFLSTFTFLVFLEVCLFAGIQWILLVFSFILAMAFAKFAASHFGKLIVFQWLLAFVALFGLVPRIISQLNYSQEWILQPDNIESVVFKKTPNVYYIEPDGYANFSEMERGYYQLDNEKFKTFLEEEGFAVYEHFRSNYTATLESNSATFAMKHHYYNFGFDFSEITNAREVIVSKNPVLDIFKRNGYKTHFFTEVSYLLANFPKMGYDVCNFDYDEVSLVSKGFDLKKDVFSALKEYFEKDAGKPKFFFIEIMSPGHVESKKNATLGAKLEKEKYIEKLKISNRKLTQMVQFITNHDPEALVVIMADHGGYLGFEYMLQIRDKQDDRDLVYSAFSALLAIKWPEESIKESSLDFRSSVNAFRLLFSYLGDNKKYLEHLQEDASYSIIKNGAVKGIYKLIDENDQVVFDKVD